MCKGGEVGLGKRDDDQGLRRVGGGDVRRGGDHKIKGGKKGEASRDVKEKAGRTIV